MVDPNPLAHLWWWFEVHTGTSGKPPAYYGFFSGFGSDLTEGGIVVGFIGAYRHHQCHVKRCPRLGKPVDGTPYIACPKHHPDHHGRKRGVSLRIIHDAHRESQEAA